MAFFWEGHKFYWLGLRWGGLSRISAKMTKKEALQRLSFTYTAKARFKLRIFKNENEQIKTVQEF